MNSLAIELLSAQPRLVPESRREKRDLSRFVGEAAEFAANTACFDRALVGRAREKVAAFTAEPSPPILGSTQLKL
jgi:hypothetical protein